MVAHLQTFHAVVDAGCRDAPPEYSQVRSDELPVSMRMRMRVVMCGNKLLEMTPNTRYFITLYSGTSQQRNKKLR